MPRSVKSVRRSRGSLSRLALSLMLATALVLTGNLLADLTYAWLDPRIKLGEKP